MATAPLRKCISGVAGTPSIDSPRAMVTNSSPSITDADDSGLEVMFLHGRVDECDDLRLAHP